MKAPFTKATDKYIGNFRGKVVDNLDPLKLGRIKVEIFPMFKGIVKEDLPWAIPAYPIFEGAGRNGIGYFVVPKTETLVYCFFEEGDFNQPVYFAEAPSKVHGIPEASQANYPDVKVLRTTSGIEIIIDDKDTTITLKHPSGSIINIDTNGEVNITSIGTMYLNATARILANAPELDTVGNLNSGTGATGTFGSVDGSLITVSKGIITDID